MGTEICHSSIRHLVRGAARAGVRLWVEGDRLCCRVPKAGIPEALRIELQAQRDGIIGELSKPVFKKRVERPAIIHYPAFWLDWWLELQTNIRARHGAHSVMRIAGGVGLERIVAGLDILARRHDLLRASVGCEDGVPSLRFEQRQSASVDVVDISNEPVIERAFREKDLLCRAIYAPFNEGQVWRATVLKTSAAEHFVAMVIHHFVGDGFTCQILASELIASLREKTVPQPEADGRPLQYSDYLLAMSEWLSAPGLEYRVAFWKEKMHRAPPVLFPPTSRRDLHSDTRADFLTIEVNAAVREAVAWAAAGLQIPLPVVLLAAKFAALARTLESTDVVVAVIHWGRDEPALLELAGFTVNCIPIRMSVQPEMSYVDLLTRVNDSYVLARDYQIPWALLMRSFSEIGASAPVPLFNYIYEEKPGSGDPSSSHPAPHLEIERLDVPAPDDTDATTVDWKDWKTHEFTVLDNGKELLGIVKYLPSRYDALAVRDFADEFLRCLDAIGKDLKQSIESKEVV